MRTHLQSAAVVTGFFLALSGAVCSGAAIWSDITRVYMERCGTYSATRWTICGLYYIEQNTPSEGGPQALEGYTVVSHARGRVALAMGTIGNIEIAGEGVTSEAVALAGNIVINGPGRLEHATVLALSGPRRFGEYRGSMDIGTVDYITFDNGISFRQSGSDVLICRRDGTCRNLF